MKKEGRKESEISGGNQENINILESRLRRAKARGEEPVSLTDSDFHRNGFLLDPEILSRAFSDYLSSRAYRPDPRGAPEARRAVADFYNLGGPVSLGLDPEPDRALPVPQETSGKGRAVRMREENVLFCASSSEAYSLLFSCFCSPGDNVLLPLPSYPLFEDLASYQGLEPRFYPLDPADNWQPDLDVLEVLCDSRSRFIVLISPNNPCGSVIGGRYLEKILGLAEREGIFIISDEVFSEFLYASDQPGEGGDGRSETGERGIPEDREARARSAAATFSEAGYPGLPGSWPRKYLPRAAAFSSGTPVFTINGISKLFACPDFKLSWIALSAGPDSADSDRLCAALMEELELRNDTFLNTNSFSQFLLPRLFKEAGSFVRSMVAKLEENREALAKSGLHDPGAGRFLLLPQGGIHAVLRLGKTKKTRSGSRSPNKGHPSEALAVRILEKEGLYVHPGSLYGLDDETSLVLSLLFGPQKRSWEEALGRLLRCLEG